MTDRLLDWLEERIGPVRPFLNEQLYHKVPRAVNPLDFLGLASAFLFINQFVTGVMLAAWYQPSPSTAWRSVYNIMHSVPGGWFVRDMHYWGANAMVVAVFLHMLRVFYVGAYKKPRELTWIAGSVLLLITILFAFTGYLLPWDQQSYWATMVGTWMPSYTPFIGQWIVSLARGGSYLSAATLTRFYAVHMLVLPALFLIFFGVHFGMVLKTQMSVVEEAEKLPKEKQKNLVTFFPTTVFQMNMFLVIVISIVVLLAANVHAPLLAPADPLDKANYIPTPIWFFYSIYQLLKYIPPALDPFGIIGLPIIAGIVLIALPFVDRSPHREPRYRPAFVSVGGVVVAGIVVLTYLGAVQQGPAVGTGTASTGTVAIAKPTYSADILPILTQYCSQCHSPQAANTLQPDLLSYSTLMAFKDPTLHEGLVVKGNPTASILYKKITGAMQPQMPLGGAPLSKPIIQTIYNWIKTGAPQ
jgi:ubiquinol-cytochrome c reductase cytochrome b subunit